MAQIEFKDVMASISPFIMVVSLCFNVYFAYLLRNKRPPLARLDEIRDALRATVHQFGVTAILRSDFETRRYRHLQHVFDRLNLMREVTVTCSQLFNNVPDGKNTRDVKLAVNEITDVVKDAFRYKDSFDSFFNSYIESYVAPDKKLPKLPVEKWPILPVEKWDDFENVKHALNTLRDVYKSKHSTINKYLSKIENG